MLETRHLSIGYVGKEGAKLVQRDLSLTVSHGQMIALVGPNGCGKSTLLRTLAALQKPLGGEIYLNKSPLSSYSLHDRAKLLSVVLTEPIEVPHLTVRTLVALARNPYTGWGGNLTHEDQAHINRSLQAVGLTDYAHRPIASLSDGERQRAMIAKALAQDTPLILLDEPTAHLDIHNRVETMLLLSRLSRTMGKAVLLSTHELELALQVSDTLWLMHPHEGISVGTPAELTQNGRLQHVFSGPSFYFDTSSRHFVVSTKESPLGGTLK